MNHMQNQEMFSTFFTAIKSLSASGEGLGGTWVIFAGYVPLGSQSPYPIIVYSAAIVDPIFVNFGQTCNFRDPSLVTFYLCIYLILNEEHFPFHI